MIHRHISRVRQGWHSWVDSDHSLAGLLLFLVIYGFVIYPLAGEDARSHAGAALAFSIVLVLGVMSTTTHDMARGGMIVLAALAFTSRWSHYFLEARAVHLLAALSAALFFGVLAGLIIRRAFRSGTITIYRIYGAIAAYVLLGVMWGELYILCYLFEPQSFYFMPAARYGTPPVSELVYFSFVSLTTMGFGDIVPVHPMARSLASLEGLVGQIYPAVLLARLITLYRR